MYQVHGLITNEMWITVLRIVNCEGYGSNHGLFQNINGTFA